RPWPGSLPRDHSEAETKVPRPLLVTIKPASGAGDRLFRAHGECDADGGRVAGIEEPSAASHAVEVQVAARGSGLEPAGAVGVANPHGAIAGRAARPVDHRGAGSTGQGDLKVAE